MKKKQIAVSDIKFYINFLAFYRIVIGILKKFIHKG